MNRIVVFAGGGTGGHLFPALAIAEHLPATQSLFACSERPLDEDILRNEGAEPRPIPANPFSTKPMRMIRFVYGWGRSLRTARAVLQSAKEDADEVHVIATGGFVAPPMVQAARVEKCPVTLVNLDAVPGRANRWIARHAGRIFNAGPTHLNGWDSIPPLVRGEALAPGDPPACRTALELDPQAPTLLVTGASQGARSVNQFMELFAERHGQALRDGGWQVIHQTGQDDPDRTHAAYEKAGLRAAVLPFHRQMGVLWGAADVAVGRAGAGLVAEAWANRVPTLFMPYPHHRDQHQAANAKPLIEAGGAVLATDHVRPEANLAEAGEKLLELLQDRAARERMAQALHRLGPVDGARRVARSITAA